ncbi:aldo/keto reductase [bacterium AH-315-L21]|nr:aldo/keto reductase [bacterium AH-315-L21]
MKYRKIPKNGDELSILGYGTMRFHTKNGRIIEQKAIAQLRGAIDRGLNYIDTAYPYHAGASEALIGKALKDGYRDKVKIATKLPPWSVKKTEDMEMILNDQLRKLQVEYIDYYLLHALNDVNWEMLLKLGVLEFLDEQKSKGKIVNVGFSFHGDKDTFKKIIDAYDWVFCMIQYNFLDEKNQAGKEGLEYAYKRDIAVMVMEPLRGGTLASNIPKEIQEKYDENKIERSPAEWALRWIWNHKEVTLLLSGMTEDVHIDENLKIATEVEMNSMSKEELETINAVKEIYEDMKMVPCTSCRYCMPCPFGVDIPRCFELYNAKNTMGISKAKRLYWFQLGGIASKKAYASLCKDCGKCVPKCPQNIDIPKELSTIATEMEGLTMKVAVALAKGFFSVQRRFVVRRKRQG